MSYAVLEVAQRASNEYPLHGAGELSSRSFKISETAAYKCSPRTETILQQKESAVKERAK